MKIVLISKFENDGGACIAANRLHKGLRSSGVDSNMLVDFEGGNVGQFVSGSKGVLGRVNQGVRSRLDKLPARIQSRGGLTNYHPAWVGKNVLSNPLIKSADIINLHYCQRGFISVKCIGDLARLGKKIVWTLHDMWAFTGGCHYSGDCLKYQSYCNCCPELSSTKKKDIAYHTFNRKLQAWAEANIHIVTPSKWMKSCAESSKIFKKNNISVIPNGLNTDIFTNTKMREARAKLDLPQNKKIMLFGSLGALSDPRKGYQFLCSAIKNMNTMRGFENVCAVIFGNASSQIHSDLPCEMRFLGVLEDESNISLAYNAADVFVAPSIEDNLPNTIIESMSCGTPVVAFRIGGIPDIITHKEDGFLAEAEDSTSLAEGIKWVLEDESKNHLLGIKARRVASQRYDFKVQSKRYIELFQRILD